VRRSWLIIVLVCSPMFSEAQGVPPVAEPQGPGAAVVVPVDAAAADAQPALESSGVARDVVATPDHPEPPAAEQPFAADGPPAVRARPQADDNSHSAIASPDEQRQQERQQAQQRQRQKQQQALMALAGILGIVIAGLSLIGLVMIWGRRLRRELRQSVAGRVPRSDFWFLKPPKPPVRPVSPGDTDPGDAATPRPNAS
jgi:hypothetical protein